MFQIWAKCLNFRIFWSFSIRIAYNENLAFLIPANSEQLFGV